MQSNQGLFGHTRQSPRCAFPARYQRLKQRWPGHFKESEGERCLEFEEWRDQIGAHAISILYVGAYPNNPASMFGHTLLRLQRPQGNWLLDYTIAFLANVDPKDGPISYTVNGITGGYTGFYHIEPYYMIAGRYNNAESRDIWEYELELSSLEVEFFLKHLWEVSLNTGYPYYFLNENCSYYLQTLLHAISARFPLNDSSVLLHPIESVRPLPKVKAPNHFRASLKKKLAQMTAKMDRSQRRSLRELIKNGDVQRIDDALVLDSYIGYLKSKNYAESLAPNKHQTFEEAHRRRAQLPEVSSYPDLPLQVNPLSIHSPSKVQLARQWEGVKAWRLRFDWGYHGIGDSEEGATQWSFIDYAGAELEHREDKIRLHNVNLIDIYSLNPVQTVLPQTSWRLDAKFLRQCRLCQNGELTFVGGGGWGFSQATNAFVTWQFLNLEAQLDPDHQGVFANLELGLKLQYSRHNLAAWAKFRPERRKISMRQFFTYQFYLLKNASLLVEHRLFEVNKTRETIAGVKIHF